MGLPFAIVQGTVLVVDELGNVMQSELAATKRRLCTDATIRGANFPYYAADVDFKSGAYRLLTDATVQVEQIFGRDNFADVWFAIGTFQDSGGVGAIGDTLTIYIAAGDNPTLFPMYTKTFTVTAMDTGATNPEEYFAERIVTELNVDSSFRTHWKASRVKDNSIIHITSNFLGEWGQRPNALDFQITTTGTTIATPYDDKIVTRGKANSGQRDPRDKRLVTVGISGEVQAVAAAVGDLYVEHPTNPTYGVLLNQNGSGTPIEYWIYPDLDKDIFVSEVRFYGNTSGIKFGQFLNLNAPLTNGILVEIRSDNILTMLDPIKTTDDFKDHFALGGVNFQFFDAAGLDTFLASWVLPAQFPLRKSGTFGVGNDDYIKVTVRDNLTSVSSLECLIYGFQKEV